jgi:hypothetical protein
MPSEFGHKSLERVESEDLSIYGEVYTKVGLKGLIWDTLDWINIPQRKFNYGTVMHIRIL